MRVLITGGSGLLGHKLVEYCLREGLGVYATYVEHTPPPSTSSNAKFVKLDITDAKSTAAKIDELKPDTVINTAAMTDVDLCEVKRDDAWRLNAQAVKNVAEACSRIDALLIQVSTAYVFDGETGLRDEDDETNPVDYYGYTKLKGEEFAKGSATRWCIGRTDVLFGWGRTYRPSFAAWVIDKLEKKESIKMVTDQYNSPTLNTNLAQMLVEIAERNIQGMLNLTGATRISRFDFAKKICKVFNLDEKLIQPIKTDELQWKAKRPKDSSLKVDKAKKLLSHAPMTIDKALEILKKERQ
jgi:dTDP-4-dehydrorhamnose reductase